MYGQLPAYLQNRLQRVQNCAAGYVLGRYASLSDNISLSWLPVVENIEFNTVRYVHQALNNDLWPDYLKDETMRANRNLRSHNSGIKINHGEKRTFQEQATIFNDLPRNIRMNSSQKFLLKRQGRFTWIKALRGLCPGKSCL